MIPYLIGISLVSTAAFFVVMKYAMKGGRK
jgi:hypothetical protein